MHGLPWESASGARSARGPEPSPEPPAIPLTDGNRRQMSTPGSAAGRRVGRILLSIVSVLVLLTTVVGAGVTVVMGQLQGNITAVDISENTGPVSAAEPLIVSQRGHRHLPAADRRADGQRHP